MITETKNHYTGNWVNSKMEGYGIYYNDKTGNSYQGEMLANKQHGFGKTINKNGDIYEGEYS